MTPAARKVGLGYFAAIALFLALADVLFAVTSFPDKKPRQDWSATLVNRTAWYQAHASDYNLVFLGDSRTYCGIHPVFIDPLLGTSSVNLSVLAHWFPTQLPQIADIAPLIPKGTTVVWSIGALNFSTAPSIQPTYPVGFYYAGRYLSWGVQRKGLLDNLSSFNPALYVFSERANLKHRFDMLQKQPLPALFSSFIGTAYAAYDGIPPNDPHEKETRQLVQRYWQDPAVVAVDPETSEGRLTSVIVRFKRGGYYRIEIDRDHFLRMKERSTFRLGKLEIDPAYYRMFDEALQMFKQNNIRLVVNEMEEAPFQYADRQWHRDFMRDVVEKRVREFGFDYIRVNFDQVTDDDYFDHNHLNSRGIANFSPMLANRLRPYVSPYPH